MKGQSREGNFVCSADTTLMNLWRKMMGQHVLSGTTINPLNFMIDKLLDYPKITIKKTSF
jgi:hypothetical protein